MLSRFKITIQYDGTAFFGWQSQLDQRTVQGEIEQALAKISRSKRIPVTGAGRTDTGVHALGQVAHFDLETRLDAGDLLPALNGNLPEDIDITSCVKTAADFNARFSARQRIYQYNCRIDRYLFDRNYIWRIKAIDLALMQSAADLINGEHDFTTFCKVNPDLAHHRCHIYHSMWKQSKSVITFQVSANRFLHHMVRYLVGTMVEVGRGRLSVDQFEQMLSEPQINRKIYRAPAQGLVLKEVVY